MAVQQRIVSVELFGDKELVRALQKAAKRIDDFRVPFTQIANDHYKRNRIQFSLQGSGKYEDLASATKEGKAREVGFIYPILVRTGRLRDSLINAGDAKSSYLPDPCKENCILFLL
jgi:hypothetical protein